MASTFWRLTKAKYATAEAEQQGRGPFSGYGSMLSAGRWHPRGRPVVYAAESAALALLETLVHVEKAALLHFAYVAIPVVIPSALYETGSVAELDAADLPGDWQAWPYPASTQQRGTAWFDARQAVALVVPSAVVPHERNVLLNPLHERFVDLEIGAPQPFPIDHRLGL
ncbi:MAG: RES domain-containing protein [Bacteroidota bacterium]